MSPTATSIADIKPSDTVLQVIGDFCALLKPRVMSLVVFTGFVGMYLSPGSLEPALQFVAIICIAVGAGASGAINMWFDRDIDALMMRTKERPIPSGKVSPEAAIIFGVLLSGGAVMIMGLAINWVSSALLGITIAFYVLIYTVWLKRRTPQNIVIGGASGAFPPLIGWASSTGGISIEPLVMFAIIFFWTPPHFWALALFRSGDYQIAKIPMLPLTNGRNSTINHIVVYSLILSLVSIMPAVLGCSGLVYLLIIIPLNIAFVWFAYCIFRNDTDKNARVLFGFSILYLFLVFSGLLADDLLLSSFPPNVL